MREKNIFIIGITVIICMILILGTFFIVNNDGNNFLDNIFNHGNDNSNSKDVTVTADKEINDIIWVQFFSDGNPGTGESATINVGPDFAGEEVEVSMDYSRDGISFDPAPYETHSVSNDGTINIYTATPMSKYPDKCIIRIRHNNDTITRTCYLEKRKGSQQVTF